VTGPLRDMGVAALAPASIPSPTQSVWELGPFPIRAYGLCILVGIVLAVLWGDRRLVARGAPAGVVLDVAVWAVPFGILGGRIYHVLTSWQPYFGENGKPLEALYIWQGGLGIWGAVALGGVGAWIGCRRAGVLLPPLADAVAPGVLLAQAIGRWGNWFNNEVYGRATDVPWGLKIYEWNVRAGHAERGPDGEPIVKGVYHPTFLYEMLWNLFVVVVLVRLDRRFRIGHGRLFALYVMLYTTGRFWIETLRVDPANKIMGLRLNLWTSVVVLVGAATYLVISVRRHPGRETSALRDAPLTDGPDTTDDAGPGGPAPGLDSGNTTVQDGAGTVPTARKGAAGRPEDEHAGEPGTDPSGEEPPQGSQDPDRIESP
jgi:prolipoprotein diacylglyceryl transferase